MSRDIARAVRPAAHLQPKLQISVPGDRYEREADLVADHVAAGKLAPRVTPLRAGGLPGSAHELDDHGGRGPSVFRQAGEARVPDFRPHVPSPIYYQRIAGLQGVRQFRREEGNDARNRLIALYERLVAEAPEAYTGNAYEEILATPSTPRSNFIAAAANTPTDAISNRTRWALQVSLLAYILEYGQPELNASFVYEWHDFAFRFAGDAPAIGKLPWWILGWADVPGMGEWIAGERGRKLGGDLIGLTIHLLNQPDATIPAWALPFRMAIDALSSFPEAFYGELARPVFYPESVQRKNAGIDRAGDTDAAVTRAIDAPGTGSPLLPATRTLLEERMAVDLSGVRVHHDAAAHELARALNARAFTHGEHVWLGAGESPGDVRLMAHEAAHVLQQRVGVLAGSPILRRADAADRPVMPGNPGRFLGLEAALVAQPQGPPRLVHFQLVEAVEGTWLSAATRALGWDRAFSKAQGYGAYVPGVVLRTDMRPFEVFHPDRIEPGQRFLVLLPEQPARGFGGGGAPREAQDIPGVNEVLELPGIEAVDVLDKAGTIIDLVGYLDEFAELGGAAGTAAGALGIFGGILSILTNMAAAGRAGSMSAVTARLRATCYATTAWIFKDRGDEVSIAFSWEVIKLASEMKEAEDAWHAAWKEATDRLGPWLNEIHASVSRKYRSRYRRPPTKDQLLEAIRQKVGGSSTRFCDQLMTSEAIVSQLKNETERLLWDMQVKATHYPD